jgi:hypothetical protein
MEINLRNLAYGQCDTLHDSMRLQSGHIVKNLNRINMESKIEYEYLIVPMRVYNILEFSPSFIAEKINQPSDGIWFVGSLHNWKCYLDINLPPDQIIVKTSLKSRRELKINSILGDLENPVTELQIKILD